MALIAYTDFDYKVVVEEEGERTVAEDEPELGSRFALAEERIDWGFLAVVLCVKVGNELAAEEVSDTESGVILDVEFADLEKSDIVQAAQEVVVEERNTELLEAKAD